MNIEEKIRYDVSSSVWNSIRSNISDFVLDSMEDSAYIPLYISVGYDMLSFIKNKIENCIDDYEY